MHKTNKLLGDGTYLLKMSFNPENYPVHLQLLMLCKQIVKKE